MKRFNEGSVPYISVQELQSTPAYTIFDTRTLDEYQISHIKNAVWVGHHDFKLQTILEQFPEKEIPIAVYCSIGVRSEFIGEKLQRAGYTHVKNLYGGIFGWKNEGHAVYDSDGNYTENVHAYNKRWGKYLTKGVKVYAPKQNRLEETPQ